MRETKAPAALPARAMLIQQAKPNAKGEMVVQVHAVGCQHQNRVAGQVLDADVDPEKSFLDFGQGVAGAVAYFIAVLDGSLDRPDGIAEGVWIARLAPCAR